MPKVDKEPCTKQHPPRRGTAAHIAPARGLQTRVGVGYASLSELIAGRAASKSLPKDRNGLTSHDMKAIFFWQSYDRLPKPKFKWLTSPGPYASTTEVSAWNRAMELHQKAQGPTAESHAAFKAHNAAIDIADMVRRRNVCEDYDKPGACDSARPVDCYRCRHHCMQSGDCCASEAHSEHSVKGTCTFQERQRWPWLGPPFIGLLFGHRPDPDIALEAALAWDVAKETHDNWMVALTKAGMARADAERAGEIVDAIRLAEVCVGYYEPGACDFQFQRGWSCDRCRHHCVQHGNSRACSSKGHGSPGEHFIAVDHALSDELSSPAIPLSPSRLSLGIRSVASEIALSSVSSASSSVSLASWPDAPIISPDSKTWSPTPTTPEDSLFSYGP